MHYYIAKLQFRISITGQLTQPIEEQIILVESINNQEAFNKALAFGKANEDEFMNINSNKVLWKFEGITNLERIGEVNSGTVLFSELKEDSSPEYLHHLQLRIKKMKESLFSKTLCNF